jgi:hypothetical protein
VKADDRAGADPADTHRAATDPVAGRVADDARARRVTRVNELGLDPASIVAFTEQLDGLDREALISAGHLDPSAPEKGLDPIGAAHRRESGEALLELAKDVLYGLLFGDESTATRFDRVQRELLTLTLPRAKGGAFDFIPAATELSGAGMWRDPDGVSDDVRADNVIVEVEFGEVAGELIGHGIVRCLSLINNLEVNEQVLYARMINIEESTLIE